MKQGRLWFAVFASAALFAASTAAKEVVRAAPRVRNVVIFVADGLRYDSVTAENAPTLWRVRHEGVDFANSHAVYPTVTTANASAIATGHLLGDTGDYANTLYTAFPNAARNGATVTFLEDDAILREVKAHSVNDYLGQVTLLQAAHAKGMRSAAVGKLGPAAIQDLAAFEGKDVLLDDVTNAAVTAAGTVSGAAALPPDLSDAIAKATGQAKP